MRAEYSAIAAGSDGLEAGGGNSPEEVGASGVRAVDRISGSAVLCALSRCMAPSVRGSCVKKCRSDSNSYTCSVERREGVGATGRPNYTRRGPDRSVRSPITVDRRSKSGPPQPVGV